MALFYGYPRLPLFQDTREVQLAMGTDCKRFGFSVIGGADEGIRPKIDDIAEGRFR